MVWDINGGFKYAIQTDIKRGIDIKWDNNKPIANNIQHVDIEYPVNVYLKKNQKKLELIPLNNNRFALIDSLGELVRGDKKDFVRLINNGTGFAKIAN